VRGIEPILTVTLVLLGATTAVATVAQLVDERKGGQVVDLRPGAPSPVYRTPKVVYGLVIVISEEGKITVEVKEPKKMFGTVIEALQKIATDIGKAGIESIADSARQRFGNDVTVEVDRVDDLPPGQ
jgi:hypothetical protein